MDNLKHISIKSTGIQFSYKQIVTDTFKRFLYISQYGSTKFFLDNG